MNCNGNEEEISCEEETRRQEEVDGEEARQEESCEAASQKEGCGT